METEEIISDIFFAKIICFLDKLESKRLHQSHKRNREKLVQKASNKHNIFLNYTLYLIYNIYYMYLYIFI